MSKGGSIRKAAVSGRFYPARERACRADIESAIAAKIPSEAPGSAVVGGIAPHAGWPFCGATIARVFEAIAGRDEPGGPRGRDPWPIGSGGTPQTLVHFGAVHVTGCDRPSVYASGTWRTPLGEIEVDEPFARALVESYGDRFVENAAIHAREHSLEVQLPFAQVCLDPGLKIVPVMVPSAADAHCLGEAAAEVATRIGRQAVAVGSTDLTHYGANYYGWAPKGEGDAALRWVRDENDRRIVDLMLALDAESIVPEAVEHKNACGPGAVAATIAFARARGATRGVLLDYTTSQDEISRGKPTDFVGYAGIAFA